MTIDAAPGVTEEWRFEPGALLGEGGYGRVYKATEKSTGRVVALKKSRASLMLNHTILNHERIVLQRLKGHPSIPAVLAYGRVIHFEYIALECMGKSFDNIHSPLSPVNVVLVADQMISALQHIHKHGLIHCDIKPSNILLHPTDQSQVYLIDYGLTRVVASNTETLSSQTPVHHLVGTLSYASLHMHYGIAPAQRDDIESLGYTLAKFASGDLPWTRHEGHGTSRIRCDQVRLKKENYTGADLAPSGLPFIGQMIDHARTLEFSQAPDYELLQHRVLETRVQAGIPDSAPVEPWDYVDNGLEVPELDPYIDQFPTPSNHGFSLHRGQIICCQLNVRSTLEGYSARAVDASGFWHDPAFATQIWDTEVRPTIVVGVEDHRYYKNVLKFSAVCIGRGVLSPSDPNVVPISRLRSEGYVTPNPEWPLEDSYCYVYPELVEFLCYPGENSPITSHWTISDADVDLLLDKLDFQREEPLKYYARELDTFARVTSFNPIHVDKTGSATTDVQISWTGTHAWDDEFLRLADQYHDCELGGMPSDDGGGLSDSYHARDHSLW